MNHGGVHAVRGAGCGARVGGAGQGQGAGCGARVKLCKVGATNRLQRCRKQGAGHGLRVLWLWPLLFASGRDGA